MCSLNFELCICALNFQLCMCTLKFELCMCSLNFKLHTRLPVNAILPLYKGFEIFDPTHGTTGDCSFQITSHVGGDPLNKAKI